MQRFGFCTGAIFASTKSRVYAACTSKLAGFDRLWDEARPTGLGEGQIARRLQGSVDAPTKPEVEVSSSFSPEMLLGRIDRVRVSSDRMSLQGVAFYDALANLGTSASRCRAYLPSLLEGSFRIEARSCSRGTSAPPVQIDESRACLGYLGLGPV